MPPPENSQPFTDAVPPKTLAEAVERTRLSRTPVDDRLREHRAELMELRKKGESVEGLVRALRQMGIRVGNETLRVWFRRELGLRPKRKRRLSESRESSPKAFAGPIAESQTSDKVAAGENGAELAARGAPPLVEPLSDLAKSS